MRDNIMAIMGISAIANPIDREKQKTCKHEFPGFWSIGWGGWKTFRCHLCQFKVETKPTKSQPWRGRRPRRQ